MHVMRQSAYNCVNYVQEWKNGTKEWSCACEKKAIFNAQPWNVARIVCLLRDSIANQLKQRKGIQLPKKHQWNEPLVIACVFMTTFLLLFASI